MTETTLESPFAVDRAKTGRAACKGCKEKCLKGELRIAKNVISPYGDNQLMKSWYHVDCFMNALLRQRPTTKRVDSFSDISNWEDLSPADQVLIIKKLNEMEKDYAAKSGGKYTANILTSDSVNQSNYTTPSISTNQSGSKQSNHEGPSKMLSLDGTSGTQDDLFKEFVNLCNKISQVDAYTGKTSVINNFFTKGTNGKSFKGDIVLWCKLLLPQVSNKVYNLKSKQLVKLYSRIFCVDHEEMLSHFQQMGDVAKTIEYFYLKCKTFAPADQSTLSIQDVENFLVDLTKLTKEDDQMFKLKKITRLCTTSDLRMLIRLIKGDLRINAGPKHVLEAVHPDAYTVFQTSRNIDVVIKKVLKGGKVVQNKDAIQKKVQAQLQLMTPVLPMLAEACKSVEMAMKKCPNGMFSEIKYDGERVQVHKKGQEFKYFSRALKPVMPHKVKHFKDYLPKAFPLGEDLVLDAEVLMVDIQTGKPLPFGTLGIHKQTEFKDAQVCLIVFDCLYYNGEVLLDIPISKRRTILHNHMTEIPNHVMFSEQKLILKKEDLADMIAEVLQLGLEGLVLKDLESTYEPGKRHWLKVKKDYLFGGAMADTADLVVLGAWYGTGKKGGMLSVFLMGCFDTRTKLWTTVTKVHTGFDDSTLERLQKELSPLMVNISQDFSRLPAWLECTRGMAPDFIAADPLKMPVWEITGTEFTKANIHTANGISVRFPRVTKERPDKDWESATNLEELTNLYKTSKEKTDVTLLKQISSSGSAEHIKMSTSKASPKKHKIKDSDSPVKRKNIKKENPLDEIIEESQEETPKKKIKKEPTTSKSQKEAKSHKESEEKSEKNVNTKLNYDLDETSSKKKIKNESKPIKTQILDTYFSKIETDNPINLEQLRNESPAEENVQVQDEFSLPSNPLPDTFKEIRIGFYPDFISFSDKDRRYIERHWIAYGGVVVKALKERNVDYLIHNNKRITLRKMMKLKQKYAPNVKHVNGTWVRECINRLEVCDPKKFAVVVQP